MRIVLELSMEDGAILARFLHYKRLCGDLDPDNDPCDAIALQVIAAARAQYGPPTAHASSQPQPDSPAGNRQKGDDMRYLVFLSTEYRWCTLYVSETPPDFCAIVEMIPDVTTWDVTALGVPTEAL